VTARDYLAAVQQRADAAADGRWVYEPDQVSDDGSEYRPARVWTNGGVDPWGEANDDYVLSLGAMPEDAEFIAASRTDVPRLAAALTAALDLADGPYARWVEDGPEGGPAMIPAATLRAVITDALTPKENDS